MIAEFLVGLEDQESPIVTSVYRHPGTKEILTWLKVGPAVVEIKDLEFLNSIISILEATKNEIINIKDENG